MSERLRAFYGQIIAVAIALAIGAVIIVLVDESPIKVFLTLLRGAFGDQANYRLLLPSDLAEGRSTSGVSGRYTPEEALTLMLAGTGLSYRMTEARTMTLEPLAATPMPPAPLSQELSRSIPNMQTQAAPKPVKVPEIVVEEVEGRGYAVDESSSATRIPAPSHDTPRSVSQGVDQADLEPVNTVFDQFYANAQEYFNSSSK